MKTALNKHITFDNDDGDDYVQESTIIKQPTKWFNEISPDPKNVKPVTDEVLVQLKNEAIKALEADVATFNSKNINTNSDYRWMKSILSKGTVSDKVAANTVLIQNGPVCNLSTLQSMVSMVKAGKKRECTAVIETLTELFLSDLLRPHAKLKSFHQRPLSNIDDISSGNITTRKKYLSHWYFEDQLKETYTTYVRALNTAAHDSVDSNKEKAIAAMYKLLAGNPEQEKNLLSNVVNKLGDPSQKVASKTMYCLTQLLFKHPNMQAVVLTEIERVLFRPNMHSRCQYYCLCFLSQYYLNHESSTVARKLIDTYFSFFKSCIKKGEVDSRMMSVLLMGVNRAYPYAKLELANISEHIDTIYKVVHVANFNVSLHALNLLYQVSDFSNTINDRFYSALYKKLLDVNITTTSQQAILLNLIYKAIVRDTQINRVKSFIKRLLQISSNVQPNFACGILYLVSQVMKNKKDAQSLNLIHAPTGNKFDDDDDDEHYYTNTDLNTSIKSDVVEIPDEADEENKSSKNKKVNKEKKNENEDTDEEKPEIVEIKLEEDNDKEKNVKNNNVGSSWVHCPTKKKIVVKKTGFDPFGRNPLYCGGEFCSYYELRDLTNHFHPSVALFARQIQNSEIVQYSGDPLKDFTLVRFLERFVFKNPKSQDELKKHGTVLTFSKRKHYKPLGLKSLNVNSSDYLSHGAHEIPVDELFLHTYLNKKYEHKNEDEDNSDLESVASEEFEDMLDKMSGFKDNEDDDEEEVDFMGDISDRLKTSTTKNKKSKNNEEESDKSEDSELSGDDEEDIGDFDDDVSDDEDLDMEGEENDDDFMDLNSEDEMSDVVFDSDDDTPAKKRDQKRAKSIVEKLKSSNSSIFASAEEFASLLEDEGSSKVAPGSGGAVSNKDKAAVKQLAWEDKRNNWIGGYKGKKGKPKGKFEKRKNMAGPSDKQAKKRKRF